MSKTATCAAPDCGVEFEVIGKGTFKYCPQHRVKNRDAKKPVERRCEQCGNTFSTKRVWQKYCSWKCGSDANNENSKSKGRALKATREEVEALRRLLQGMPHSEDLRIVLAMTQRMESALK